jgi:exosortase
LPAALPVVALLAFAYFRTLRGLWETWTTNDNYSHGPLVPLVALALVWGRRRRLAGLPIRGHWAGVALMLAAGALQVAGIRSDIFSLQGWSFVAMLFGLSLALLGTAWTRVLAFPLAFLTFMLTFPPVIVNQLSFALKEVTVRISTRVAEALGATLLRDGMTLYLSSGELRIENPCSGLRSLLALLATGALFAGLQRGAWWRRLLLFLLAVPIAMAANAVRITLLILVGHYGSVAQAGGWVHDGSGYLLYGIALAGLLVARALLDPKRSGRARDPRPALDVLVP